MKRYRNLLGISISAALVVACMPAAPALEAAQEHAQSPFEGAWIIETHLGPRPLEGVFHVDGTALTGTIKLGGGSAVAITSGQVKNKTISFGFKGEGGEAMMLKGTLMDGRIEFVLTMPPNEDGPEYSGKRKP